ncbi:MAG: stage V sporulation protein AD [Defluviitaleaceae bacterium]|nr:stage V sporulation protein AD [Defluviitaleaceae bacterium]
MNKNLGRQSVAFENCITVTSVASVVGKKEGEGPLGARFDEVHEDAMLGKKSWEQGEAEFLKKALEKAAEKASLTQADIDYVVAGDLMNQSTSSSFVLRDMPVPFFGIFGACSAFGEGLGLGSVILDGGFARHVLVGAASHFCAAEKQFRFPLELGGQRPLTATWTVTGAGAAVLSLGGEGPYVRGITTGKIIDMGVKDMANMGAAMAPAAADTMAAHLREFGRSPGYYDVIATGDLGYVGRELVVELMAEQGYDIRANYTDCGIEIYDQQTQDTHSGGSGCACSAVTFAAMYYPKLVSGELRRVLLIPTGALGNQTTALQGESIPGIAHAVVIESAGA